MTITIDIEYKYIACMRHFMARNSIRPRLNGIHLESTEESARLVATDDTLIGVLQLPFTASAPVKAIIPANLLDMVKPPKGMKGTARMVEVAIGEVFNSARSVALTYAGATYSGVIPVEECPNYRLLLGKTRSVSWAPAQYDFYQLARIAKASEELNGKHKHCPVAIGYNGLKNPSLFTIGNWDFIGAIMPCITSGGDAGAVPGWVFE